MFTAKKLVAIFGLILCIICSFSPNEGTANHSFLEVVLVVEAVAVVALVEGVLVPVLVPKS